jgi:hypothetical protein
VKRSRLTTGFVPESHITRGKESTKFQARTKVMTFDSPLPSLSLINSNIDKTLDAVLKRHCCESLLVVEKRADPSDINKLSKNVVGFKDNILNGQYTTLECLAICLC